MKILFLDIDGVLNSESWLVGGVEKDAAGVVIAIRELDALDPVAISLINSLASVEDLKVVVSSSWRHDDQCREKLWASGFDLPIHDDWRTPRFNSGSRGQEIQCWLNDHPEVERFAIVDDDSDMDHLKKFLVQTTFKHGLASEHILEIYTILNFPILSA